MGQRNPDPNPAVGGVFFHGMNVELSEFGGEDRRLFLRKSIADCYVFPIVAIVGAAGEGFVRGIEL